MNPECPITLRAIVHHVARSRGVEPRHIYGRRQDKKTSEARWIVYWLTRELPGMSSAVAGRLLGDRDHSTILWGAREIEKRRAADPALAAELEGLQASLSGSARLQLAGLLADPDAAAAAARIALAVDPIREGLRASALEVAAIAVRANDLEEIAATTFQLLMRSNRARDLSGDAARDYAAGTRDLIDAVADALATLGYQQEQDHGEEEGEGQQPARAAE